MSSSEVQPGQSAREVDVVGRIEEVPDPGGEDVVLLRLYAALAERGPVHHLEVDDEAHVLELLLGDQREVVHPLVLLGGHEADRLAGVAGFLEQAPGLVLVALVPGQAGDLRVPGRQLLEGQARVHPVELGLAAGHRLHDRLDVEGGLPGLAELLARHQAFLLVEDGDEPVVRLDDDGLHVRVGLEPIVGVGHQVVGEVEVARFDLGRPAGRIGDRDPAQLVHVARPWPPRTRCAPRSGACSRRTEPCGCTGPASTRPA